MPRPPRRPLAILGLAVLAAWGLLFIWRSSFVHDGQRVFSLADDAMISMAYARNLLEGHGLDWSRRGDPVEGFTHPLWLLPMILAGAVGLPLALRAAFVQATSLGLLLAVPLALEGLFRRSGAPEPVRRWALASAAVLTLTYYPILYWSLMGMETAAQLLLGVLILGQALTWVSPPEAAEGGSPWTLGVLVGLAFLLRMDMILPAAAVIGAAWLHRRRSPGRGRLVGLLVPVGATVAVLFVGRYLLFGELLPNTYYLKLTGVPLAMRWWRGLFTLQEFAAANLAFVLPATAFAGWAAVRRPAARLCLAATAVAWLYNVHVGGDVWENLDPLKANRFLILGVPPLVAAAALGLGDAVAAVGRRWWPRWQAAALALVTLGLGAAANGLFNAEAGTHLRNLALLDPPRQVEAGAAIYGQLMNLRPALADGATIAVVWAGLPAYFSDYRMVDVLGYNDREIARRPSVIAFDRLNYQMYRPGHVKWDWDYLVRRHRPDLIFQSWPPDVPAMEAWRAHMKTLGYRHRGGYMVRPDSKYLRLRYLPRVPR